MEQERIFRRICHTRGISLDAIKNLSDEEIIRQFWHHLKVADLNHLNPFAIDDCEAIVEKMKHRETRNKRYAAMLELEKSGYFELAKAKERDPGLYDQVVGKDAVGRPKEMKFSDVLMRCWMQEKDPDTGERKIDKPFHSNKMKDPSDPDYEEEEEEEEEEENDENEEENEDQEEPVADLINEDLSPEERQEEFLNLMKERFVDGKDPEFDYDSLVARDSVKDNDLTDAWFDEEEEAVLSPENSSNKKPASDSESEDDYMTMDLSKL